MFQERMSGGNTREKPPILSMMSGCSQVGCSTNLLIEGKPGERPVLKSVLQRFKHTGSPHSAADTHGNHPIFEFVTAQAIK